MAAPSPAVAEGLLAAMREKLHAGALEEAFRVGEFLLDARPDAETFDGLLGPLRQARRDALAPPATMHALLPRARALAPSSPWAALLEVDLLHRLSCQPEALAAARALAALPRRYAWMRHARAVLLLHHFRDYDAASSDFAAVHEAAPVFWKAEAGLAEAALCRGDEARAFAVMDGLAARLAGPDRAGALAWRGELHLWRGRYEAALADLSESDREGCPLAGCWRGGALLRLGRAEEAVAVLDAHLARCPDDQEALVWRAEALRVLGRTDRALSDLDRVGQASLWALANRALCRGAAGDAAGMRADYLILDRPAREYFELELGAAGAGTPDGMRAVLAALLSAGGGIRRADPYLRPLWLPWMRTAR